MAELEQLQQRLSAVKAKDQTFLREVAQAVPTLANEVTLASLDDMCQPEFHTQSAVMADSLQRLQFVLRRYAGQELRMWLELLFSSILSSKMVGDLQRFNPYCSKQRCSELERLVVAGLLHSSRLSLVNECLTKLLDLYHQLQQSGPQARWVPAELQASLVQKAEALAAVLTTSRQYMDVTLRQLQQHDRQHQQQQHQQQQQQGQQQEMQSASSDLPAAFSFPLQPALPQPAEPASGAASDAQTAVAASAAPGTATAGALERSSSATAVDAGKILCFDPRYLVFEFTWNIVLRKAQVQLVREIMQSMRQGRSTVKQLIMGQGKTTVIGPLVCLMLADGNNLVAEVVPAALLEFSRSVLRKTFSAVIRKRVYTFFFERSSQISPATRVKLERARRTAAVVVTTPTCVKSAMLKYFEALDILADEARPFAQRQAMSGDAKELCRVLEVFRQGSLLMDEVDLILHPLRSELNFPVGPKQDLDLAPLRWELAIHLLDAIFVGQVGRSSVGFEDSGFAQAASDRLKEVVHQGFDSQALQRNPHIVLLDLEWYHQSMKPVLAEWCLVWLEAHHVGGIGVVRDELLRFLLEPWSNRDAALHRHLEQHLTPLKMKLLNLAHDWLRSYAPHCLQKIDRVSFGIMNASDRQQALRVDPRMPLSRFKLAIPFVGKDVPSRSSEFAHPDVIIGLTVLAYRYEGLRWTDFEEVISMLTRAFQKEVGPRHRRPTGKLYARWVTLAGGTTQGSKHLSKGTSAESSAPEADDVDGGGQKEQDLAETEAAQEAREVMPLYMLDKSNDEQMRKAFDLLKRLPELLHWYLCQSVFPVHLRHQTVKLSASGQSVGGDMMFQRRVGFSGTPSDLLPLELGQCGYEKGSDGRMLHVVTDPEVMTCTLVPVGWTVRSLLDHIATRPRHQHFKALIDTGALITGLSNKQVAAYLLRRGLAWCDGVVFLDEEDRKMILVRATGRVVPVEQCGVPLHRRFAFYDQVHTTGMDIQHALSATAALTLGKDMTFRDFVQGAFRMRGIAKGQRICVLIIPEVLELLRRELRRAQVVVADVAAAVGLKAGEPLQDMSSFLRSTSRDVSHELTAAPAPAPAPAGLASSIPASSATVQSLAKDSGVKGMDVSAASAARGGTQAHAFLRQQAPMALPRSTSSQDSSGTMLRTSSVAQVDRAQLQLLLENITAWLLINSMRSERIQYNQLCAQNLSNIWRKVAQNELRESCEVFATLTPVRNKRLLEALQIFKEPVDYTVESSAPKQQALADSLRMALEQWKHFVTDDLGQQQARGVIAEVEAEWQAVAETSGVEDLDPSHLDTTATREQEQEQEKEVEDEREREVHREVDMAYSRDQEQAVPWKFATLAQPADQVEQFYAGSSFALYQTKALPLPSYVLFSRNYFDHRWSGERRLKNVVMVMEWVPNTGVLRLFDSAAMGAERELEVGQAGPETGLHGHGQESGLGSQQKQQQQQVRLRQVQEQEQNLRRAFEYFTWLAGVNKGGVDLATLQQVLRTYSLTPVSLETAQQVMAEFGGPAGTEAAPSDSLKASKTLVQRDGMNRLDRQQGIITFDQFRRFAQSGHLTQEQEGRYFVALSLAEAETIRRILHVRLGQSVLEGNAATTMALRCLPVGHVVFDRALGWSAASDYNTGVAAQTLRFVNCDMYYTVPQINLLLHALQKALPRQRRQFFERILGCRRRLKKKWKDTPLSAVFQLPDQWYAFRQRALAAIVRESVLSVRGIKAFDACIFVDADKNGLLSPAELFGAFAWLDLMVRRDC